MMKRLGLEPGYNPLPKSREQLLKYQPKLEDLPPRAMQDSFTSAIIPLSTDRSLQDKYVTYLGNVRFGRLLEDMDLFAGMRNTFAGILAHFLTIRYFQLGAVINTWFCPICRREFICRTPL